MPGFRLLSISNPADGVLLARFNRQLSPGEAGAAGKWSVAPATTGADIALLDVAFADVDRRNVLVISYSGGNRVDYIASTNGIVDVTGAHLEDGYSTCTFTLSYPSLPLPRITLFDTVWGPVGLAQRLIERRTIDQTVINRALALGTNQQIQLRVAAAGGVQSGDPRPGGSRLS